MADRKIARQIAAAISSAARGETASSSGARMIALTCTRQRHIAVHVAPFQCATAILFLQEIGGLQPLPLELLMHIYGLTRSEARLTSLLAQDFDLEAAAAALRISRSTAKTHLEHVFHKTGTRRQSQLIRKALSPFPGAS